MMLLRWTSHCDRNTVRKWIKSPPGAVRNAERAGRPTIATPNTKNKIRHEHKDKFSPGLRHVFRMLNFFPNYVERGKKVSHITLSRHVTTAA